MTRECFAVFGRKRCIDRNEKAVADRNGQRVCGECGRVNGTLYPITVLPFEPIGEKYPVLLSEKRHMCSNRSHPKDADPIG